MMLRGSRRFVREGRSDAFRHAVTGWMFHLLTGLSVVTTVLFGLSILGACTGEVSGHSESVVKGSIASWWGGRPVPAEPTKLRTIYRRLNLELACIVGSLSENELDRSLMRAVAESGGLPRWQVRQLLFALIDPDQALCGGNSCQVRAGFARGEIDAIVDRLARKTEQLQSHQEPELTKHRSRLAASFKADFVAPRRGLPQQSVKFNNPAVSQAIALQRGGSTSVNYGSLGSFDKLTLRVYSPQDRVDFSDLPLFPRLKKLAVSVWRHQDLELLLPYIHLVDELEFFPPPSPSAPELTTGHLRIFATVTNIKAVELTGVKIDDPRDLVRNFSYAKALSLTYVHRAPDRISDEVMRAVGQMPFMRRLTLNVAGVAQVRAWSTVLPKAVRDVRVNLAAPGDCGGLEPFVVFRYAASLALKHCLLRSLGPLGTPVEWRQLRLEHLGPVAPGTPAQLHLSGDFDRLVVFDAPGSRVQLDPEGQQELARRLARGWDGKGEDIRDLVVDHRSKSH